MVMNRHHPLARDELVRALIAYTGTTTDDGNIGGTTLQDRRLIGSNDFISNKTILIGSGDTALEDSGAVSFAPLTGIITVSTPFSAQIEAGTIFRVLNISTVEIDVDVINTKIGTNTDPAGTTTLFAWLANIFGSVGTTQGLVYYGVVTEIPGANQFTIPTLAGLGQNKFIDMVGLTPYYAFVFRDAGGGGAAPQGEYQPVTAYTTLDGTFATNAFTGPVGVGDEILIVHPFLARIMNFFGLPPHVGSSTGNWQLGVATSGETGDDLVSIGAANTKYKIHSLLLNISALTLGATITVKLFTEIIGTERKVYSQSFTQGTDPDGLWIVNGTIGIHNVLRVEVESDNAGDNGLGIDYDYLLEAM